MGSFGSLSTAQKVRIWFMLGIVILGLICIIVADTEPEMTLGGTVAMSASNWSDLAGGMNITLLCLLALGALGPITLYRFLNPKVVTAPSLTGRHSAAYGPPPSYPEYQQPQYPPSTGFRSAQAEDPWQQRPGDQYPRNQ